MKILLTIILFCSLILGGFSAVFKKSQPTIFGHERECFDKEENKYYKIGEEMKWTSEKHCGRKICGYFKGEVYQELQTCQKTETKLPPGCDFKSNLSLPYPDCCSRIVCRVQMNSNFV